MTQTVEEFATEMRSIGPKVGADNSKALAHCADVARENFQENYDRSSTAGGVLWPEHAPATVKRYGPHPLLILSGKMQAATVDKDASGHVERIEPQGMEMGVSKEVIPQAGAQNYGFGNIPQREFLNVGEETLDQMGGLLAEFGLETFGL